MLPATLLDPARVQEVIALMRDGETNGFEQLVTSLATELVAFHSLPLPKDSASLDVTRRAAHSLKGACLSIGAKALGEHFAAMERHARDGQFAEVATLSASSRDLSANSIHALRVFAQRAANG